MASGKRNKTATERDADLKEHERAMNWGYCTGQNSTKGGRKRRLNTISCTQGENGTPILLTHSATYTTRNSSGKQKGVLRLKQGTLCRLCVNSGKRLLIETEADYFISQLVSNMAYHQSETYEMCKTVVENLRSEFKYYM